MQTETSFDELTAKVQESRDIRLWLDYSTRVRDDLAVLKHVLAFAQDDEKPQVHLALAMVYESRERDFQSANECYLTARPHLDRKHAEFIKRMEQRYEADVKVLLGYSPEPSSTASKKRSRSPVDSEQLLSKYYEGVQTVKDTQGREPRKRVSYEEKPYSFLHGQRAEEQQLDTVVETSREGESSRTTKAAQISHSIQTTLQNVSGVEAQILAETKN